MNRNVELIVSQGRVADRTDGALRGARAAADALGEYLGQTPIVVGSPSPAVMDDWTDALPAAHETLTGLKGALSTVLDAERTPVLLTNTCAASLGTLPTVAERYPDAVVLWIDAHGDFNTPETTASGYLGGMVLAAACGLWESGHGAGLDPRQVIVIGGRDIDPAESELLASSGVRVLAPSDVTAARVAELVSGREVWIHVDWDVLEPGYVPAAYRVPDGLRPHQIADIFAALRDQIRGVELAEFEYGDADVPSHVSVELILQIFIALNR